MRVHCPSRFLNTLMTAACVLAGCSILPPSKTVEVYRLPASPSRAHGPTTNLPEFASGHPGTTPVEVPSVFRNARTTKAAIRVATIASNQSLDKPQIAVVPEGDVLSSYAGARWAESAPALLQRRLVEALNDSGTAIAVGESSDARTDLELESDLGAFQVEYQNGKPIVTIALDARLFDLASRRILAMHSFQILETPTTAAIPDVVKAFGRASDRLGHEVSQWAAPYAQSEKPP